MTYPVMEPLSSPKVPEKDIIPLPLRFPLPPNLKEAHLGTAAPAWDGSAG